MTRRRAAALALAGIATCCLPATSLAGQRQRRGDDGVIGSFRRPPAFLAHLFRPELVMKNQAAIGLTDAQRTAITAAIRETQDRLLPMQWELEAQSEQVAKLFATPRIDPDAALAAAAPVMDIEQQIKKEHLRLLIRIKNELTPEQQEKLRALHPEGCGPGRR
jgi:hypothetical protein